MGADHPGLSAEVQAADPDSVLNFTRRFLEIRRASPALVRGEVRFVEAPDDLLVMVRTYQDETVTCVFNLGGAPCDLPADLALDGEVLASSGWDGAVQGRSVPAYSVAIVTR